MLWLTEAIHVTITAILVVVVGTLVGIPDFNAEVGLQSFASPIIYLFFGGFALAAALHVQKLDRKIALKILSLSGGKYPFLFFKYVFNGLFLMEALFLLFDHNFRQSLGL